MLISGLLSVSFRALTPQKIIELAVENKLESIEWGSDIHLPPNQMDKVLEIQKMMCDKNLITSSYGSYYRFGEENAVEFERYLEVAKVMKAPTIRVWAGSKASNIVTQIEKNQLYEHAVKGCELAKKYDMTVTFEFHSNTLTDSLESLFELKNAINSPVFRSGWQPSIGKTTEQRVEELRAVLPFLGTVHVFHWHPEFERLSLEEGESSWLKYFAILKSTKLTYPVSLEFLKDDSIEQLKFDACTLKKLIQK